MITETRESKDRYCSPDLELVRQLNEILAKDRKEIEALQVKTMPKPDIMQTMHLCDVSEEWLNGHASEFNEQVFSDRMRYQDEHERADMADRVYWANK